MTIRPNALALNTGLTLLMLGCIPINAVAETTQVEGDDVRDRVFGFTLNDEIINPRCLDLLQTSLAETTTIIMRSLVLDTCQTSELAYAGLDYEVRGDDTIFYYANPDDGRSYFGYRVLGRTTDDRFVVYHLGSIALYQIETETIDFDFLNHQAETVQVLTKLSESFTPCFQSATITPDDTLTIQAEHYEPNAPRAEQCTGILETITHALN
ncbi:MAG: hypothetical protein AAFX95_27400 [Cyanobacteria bacterium J06639_16]